MAFALVTISANAQKGSWYLGGNAGFSATESKSSNGNTTVNDGKSTSWSFSPEVGTFITNHVQVGVGVIVYGNKYNAQSSPITNINKGMSYGGTLYGRYFFWERNV